MNAFEQFESNVRYYCRRWPVVFARSHGSTIFDEDNKAYLDFFAGAGVLSYGHNNPELVEVALSHLRSGKLLHSLDTFTVEKRDFLTTFEELILKPRHMDMVVQAVGPTGATAVEAALQLAQRVTGNRAVLGFEGGYHGMTYRAASVSHSMAGRETVAHIGDFVALPFVAQMTNHDLDLLDQTLRAGIDGQKFGAILIEATQGEGGARAFDSAYLSALRAKASEFGIMVIADEVQAGVGRTGAFFSFEGSGLDPDIVCLSKAISGLGLPMAINLIRRNLDTWSAGEFTGTFRGNNLAFATSTKMLQTYWKDNLFEHDTKYKGIFVRNALQTIADTYESLQFTVNGNGLLCGLDVKNTELADRVAHAAFDRQLIVETCGTGDRVVKLLPPLTTTDEELREGLERLSGAFAEVCVASVA
jgi:diaminobutyrate-2-oxoglutarate transaminase